MSVINEVVEHPLTRAALAARYRELCDDPYFANIPGKIELDAWGRLLMSPATTRHSVVQSRLNRRLDFPGGECLVEVPIAPDAGLLVVDVAWMSTSFMAAHASESPFLAAPELCVEVASPSNSKRELREEIAAYLHAGAVEAWVVYPQSRRIERFGPSGAMTASAYPFDETGLLD